MGDALGTRSCFLVEWYQTGPVVLSAEATADQFARTAATSDRASPASLLMALAVPDDRTVFAVFCAVDENAVVETCRQAGWPPDRISRNVQAWPTCVDAG